MSSRNLKSNFTATFAFCVFVALFISSFTSFAEPPDGGDGTPPPPPPAPPATNYSAQIVVEPKTERLGDIIDSTNNDGYNFFRQIYGDSVSRSGANLALQTSRPKRVGVYHFFVHDVAGAAVPLELKFRLTGGTIKPKRCGASGAGDICVVAYKFRNQPVQVLQDLPNGFTSLSQAATSFNPAVPDVTLVVVNLSNSAEQIRAGELELEVQQNGGPNVRRSNSSDITLFPEGNGSCRIAVAGATGPVVSESCNSSSCSASQVTPTANSTLGFEVVVQGLPESQSTPTNVVWTPSAVQDGAGSANLPTDMVTNVVAEVELRNGQTTYCSVRVRPQGVQFRVRARYGGDCGLFTDTRNYYFLNDDNTAIQQDPYVDPNGDAGLAFPGINVRYGLNGPQIPYRGVYNAGADLNGFVQTGTGGRVVLPPFDQRMFADPVLVATPFNPGQSSGSRFGDPIAFGRVDLNGDPSTIEMRPVTDVEGNPVGLPEGFGDESFVVLRYFLPRSIKSAATPGVELRGSGGLNPEYFVFLPEIGDIWVPFIEDSCSPFMQVVPPLRGKSGGGVKPQPDILKNSTLCMNSRPYKWGDVSNGRLSVNALQITPISPIHSYPTDLLRSTASGPGGQCVPNGSGVTRPCWDVDFSELPPNIGDEAFAAHANCSYTEVVNTTTTSYDRYGRPYQVTVPTLVTRYRDNCAILESPNECTSRLAIRFAGYTMMKTAALACASKYDTETGDPAVRFQDMNGVAVTATLPGRGVLPYNSTFGGIPRDFSDYGELDAAGGRNGLGCIPCRFGNFANQNAPVGDPRRVASIPLDASARKPIFTFTKSRAPANCVTDTNVQVRYFGSDQCSGDTSNLPAGHFCSSDNIAPVSCPSSDTGAGGNLAAVPTIPFCPGAGLNFDNIAVSWSPLILETADEPIRISRTFHEAVRFDIKGDGQRVLVDWPSNTDKSAFLVLPDKKGRVTSIKQLFGDHRAKNGFESLRKLDSNRDGFINASDKKFSKLRLWFDRNRNGISEEGEIEPLGKFGVSKVSLAYHKPVSGGIEGKTLKGYYYNASSKKFRTIADIFFYEYFKNGKPVGFAKPSRSSSSEES